MTQRTRVALLSLAACCGFVLVFCGCGKKEEPAKDQAGQTQQLRSQKKGDE